MNRDEIGDGDQYETETTEDLNKQTCHQSINQHIAYTRLIQICQTF